MKLYKFTLFFVFVFFTLSAKCQFYGYISSGFSLPEHSTNNFYKNKTINIDHSNNEKTENIIDTKFNLVMSPNVKVGLGYLLNKNYRFSVECSYYNNMFFDCLNSNNNYTTTTQHYNWLDGAIFRNYITTESSFFYSKKLVLAMQYAYVFNIKNISISPSIDFAVRYLYIYQNTYISTTTMYPEYPDLNYETTSLGKYKYPFNEKFNKMLILKPGVEIAFNSNKNVQFFLSIKKDFFNESYYPSYKILYYSELRNNDDQPIINENEYMLVSSLPGYFLINSFDIDIGINYYF